MTALLPLRRFYQGQPGTSSTTLHTAPPNKRDEIVTIVVANTTGTAATITLGVVASGASLAAANHLLSAVSVAPNRSIVVDGPIAMEPGDTIRALQGTASALTVTVSGR